MNLYKSINIQDILSLTCPIENPKLLYFTFRYGNSVENAKILFKNTKRKLYFSSGLNSFMVIILILVYDYYYFLV